MNNWVRCAFLWGGMMIISGQALASLSAYHIQMEGASPYYSPKVASVVAGRPIHVMNHTASPHTITHDDCGRTSQCAFDSGVMTPGTSFSIRNLPPGSYSYHCRLHPIMRGVLVVVDSVEVRTDSQAGQSDGEHMEERLK